MELSLISAAPLTTQAVGQVLSEQAELGDVVILTGDLGAGKTEFVKGYALGLGISESVVSPTFTIVHEYFGREALNHVDAYRLESVQEYLDLGLEERMDSSVTVVEWGELVGSELSPNRLEVVIEFGVKDDTRIITLRPMGDSWLDRLTALAPVLAVITPVEERE